MISAIKYITQLVLSIVLPVLTTVVTAVILAIVISAVASTMGYDFVEQYQAILKHGFIFVIPGILSVIFTIVYWLEIDD